MKKFTLETSAILVLGALAMYVFPWWSIVVVAAVIAFFQTSGNAKSYAAGLVAGGLIWGLWASYLDAQNLGILSARMGALFQGLTGTQLLWATGFLGGL